MRCSPTALSILLSTLGKDEKQISYILDDFCGQTFTDFDVVIVIQSDQRSYDVIKKIFCSRNYNFPITLVRDSQKGICRSRNLGLRYVRGSLVLLCEDDCRYPPEATQTIISSAMAHPEWGVLTFQAASGPGGPLLKKNFLPTARRHTIRTLLQTFAIGIVLRRETIMAWGPPFDERYGNGTIFFNGAECAALVDLHRLGVVCGAVPETVVWHPVESSGRTPPDHAALAFAKGAIFRRIFGWYGFVWVLAFFLPRFFSKKRLRFQPKHVVPLFKGFFATPAKGGRSVIKASEVDEIPAQRKK